MSLSLSLASKQPISILLEKLPIGSLLASASESDIKRIVYLSEVNLQVQANVTLKATN